ncbi:MAG: YeeE/YedE family protein, partial [Thermodesulfovibrionales bacterium]
MLLHEPFYLFSFNLIMGIILGSIFYRADYCMAGIFRDVFLFRDYSLLRSLLLLVVTAMFLFYLA